MGIWESDHLVEIALVDPTQNGIDCQVGCAIPDVVDHAMETWSEVRQRGVACCGIGTLEAKLVPYSFSSVPPIQVRHEIRMVWWRRAIGQELVHATIGDRIEITANNEGYFRPITVEGWWSWLWHRLVFCVVRGTRRQLAKV